MFAGLKHIGTPDGFEPYGHLRNKYKKFIFLFPKIKNIFYEKPDFDDTYIVKNLDFSWVSIRVSSLKVLKTKDVLK